MTDVRPKSKAFVRRMRYEKEERKLREAHAAANKSTEVKGPQTLLTQKRKVHGPTGIKRKMLAEPE